MSHDAVISQKRQLWNLPTETTTSWSRHCTPFVLPSNGVLQLEDSRITLTTNVVFTPECTGTGIQDVTSIADLKQPFYASTIPQTYVIAAATVIAWILVIMLIITPRTNFFGHSGAAPGFSSGRGIIGGATGGTTNLIGVGSRPWLQKVAALTVAISLTIATADTFEAAKGQYEFGYMDADKLRRDVLESLEIRVTRVISDVFLWLAQVQTLIRLFPRHKEKVLIKWIGFALILFDSLFSCLNSFLVNTAHTQPRQFADAIPALSYLFELALSLLYAAWVMYYSLTKRRYAFYHSKMRSITLIACLSLVAVLTPVVFFVTDVSNPDVAGWGDYFRWVGAAAASVVVWEWVERIEAIERDEKKDGILGREVFDGDEMLDVMPNDDVIWTSSRTGRKYHRGNEKDDDSSGGNSKEPGAVEKGLGGMVKRFKPVQRKTQQHFPLGRAHSTTTTATPNPRSLNSRRGQNGIAFGHLPKPNDQDDENMYNRPTPPLAVASPVSRADTTSAASTVYVVQHNPAADVPLPVRRRADASGNTERTIAQARAQHDVRGGPQEQQDQTAEQENDDFRPNPNRDQGAWYSVQNPFKRKRASPPVEVRQAQASDFDNIRAATPAHNFSPWDVKNQLGVLAAETSERLRNKRTVRKQHVEGPLTIIPAQPRGSGRTWTPPPANQQPVAQTSTAASNDSSPSHDPNGSTTLTANSNPALTSSQHISYGVSEQRQNPLGAGGVATPPVASPHSQSSNAQPPRASDLSPIRGDASPVIVPAPRRSTRSSPLATFHASASSSSDSRDDAIDGNDENG